MPKHWEHFLVTEETEEDSGKKPQRDNDGLPTNVLLTPWRRQRRAGVPRAGSTSRAKGVQDGSEHF